MVPDSDKGTVWIKGSRSTGQKVCPVVVMQNPDIIGTLICVFSFHYAFFYFYCCARPVYLSVAITDAFQVQGIDKVSASHEEPFLILIQQHCVEIKKTKGALKY